MENWQLQEGGRGWERLWIRRRIGNRVLDLEGARLGGLAAGCETWRVRATTETKTEADETLSTLFETRPKSVCASKGWSLGEEPHWKMSIIIIIIWPILKKILCDSLPSLDPTGRYPVTEMEGPCNICHIIDATII